jgi:ABC transporter
VHAPEDLEVTAPAIEISALSKIYRGGLVAVDHLSMSLPRGAVLGLLGPNGAGKTTTIKMIAGLIASSAGRIRLNGYDVSRQRSLAVRQIGAVLEGSRNGPGHPHHPAQHAHRRHACVEAYPADQRHRADARDAAAVPVIAVPAWWAETGRVFPLTAGIASLNNVTLQDRSVTQAWAWAG